MAVSFVAASAVVAGENPTVVLPSGVIEKDLLILVTIGTATPTTPAGWTQRSVQGGNNFLTIIYKFATGTETASVALTLTGASSNAVILVYRGASAIDTVSGFTNNLSGTSLAPGQTGNTQPNEREITIYAANNVAGTWGAAPSPTTSRVSSNPTSTVKGLLIVDETQVLAGNSTARTGTITGTHLLSAVAIAVIPSGRYWVGGTGTWTTTTTNWSQTSGGASGAPAPTANDPVFFDQAATYTVTLTGGLSCFGLTVSAGTVTFTSTGTITNSASISLIAGTIWSATGLLTFNSTSTGRTITTNAISISSPITFNGVGGVWSLSGALSSTAAFTLTSGSVNQNGYFITTTTTFTYTGGTFVNGPYITCATFTLNGPTLTLNSPYQISPSTSFVVTTGTFTLNDGIFPAVPTFTHTAGTVTFNYSYSLTATGTYTFTAGTLILAQGVKLTTGIFSSSNTNTRTIGFGSVMATNSTGSIRFNGSTQYLSYTGTTSDNLDLASGAGNWTVECWFYTTTTATSQAIFWKGGTTGSVNPSYALFLSGATPQWIVGDGAGGGGVQNLTSISAYTWYHFALVRNGNTLTSYVNGVAGTPVTMSFTMSNTGNNNFNIGNSAADGSSRPLSGYVSNFRIVKGIAVYTSNFTPASSQLSATQGANINGSPSAAISGTQTSLLFNTLYGINYLTDISGSRYQFTNVGGSASVSFTPFSASILCTHTTAAQTVINMATATGFSWTGSGGFITDASTTRTISIGNTAGGSVTTAPNVTILTGASVVTITTASWINDLDYGSSSYVQAASTLNLDGGLALSTGGTFTALTVSMVGTGLITSSTKTITALTVNSISGTLTAMDALTLSGALTLTRGAIIALSTMQSATFASSGPYTRSITAFNKTYTITGAGATAWSFASTGSVLFNGTSQYLIAPVGSSTFGSGDFTVECWFYKTSATTCTLIDNATGNADNNYWALSTYADGHCQFTIRDNVGQITLIGTITTALNTWAHVAIVRQSGVCSLYINGVFDTSTTIATTITGRTTNIGSFQYTGFVDYFPGYITNVRTVTGVAVYTGNFTVPTKPLTPTQSADTNISAITGSQTSLLLTTSNDSTFLKDYSNNNFTITNTGTATANALSPFTVTSPGITFTGFTINMTSASAKTFAGNGATYPVLNNGGAGALTISGSNTFDTISNSVQPTTFTFTIATTQTVNNFNVAGIAGSLVTINSSTAATAATLSKASGTVYGSYLSIRDSTATGGATWYAGPTSTNTSNNTGWIFTRLPIISFGNITLTSSGFTISNDPIPV